MNQLASIFGILTMWYPEDIIGTHFIPGVIGISALIALATWAVFTPNKT